MNDINSSINVLGLNFLFHDSAAVMLKNGIIAAALEEERWFRDDKHTAIFPRRSIIYCLESIGCSNEDLHHVAVNMDPIRCLSNSSSPIDLFFHPYKWNKKHWKNYLIRKQACKDVVWQMHRTLLGLDIDQQFQFHFVPHHDSHAASAFFVSPFEEAAVLTIDANGEWPTLTTSIGRGNRLKKLASIGLPNSIGGFYASITEHLGFKRNSDEFKVMGLAGYGDPNYYRKAMQELIFATEDGFFRVNPSYFDYAAYKISPKPTVANLLGCPARRKGEEIKEYHKGIAAALQEHTENIVIHIARNLQKKTGLKKLCLAGGVALNCVMNSAILEGTDFEEIFVQPAAHDAGSALGAASWVYHQVLNRPREYVMDRVDFGPSFSDDCIENILKSGMLEYQRSSDIAKDTARLIADGNIVGWFQGRAEFGPRALGYRSILADPTNIGMQDHLNLRVKHREDFRPFAPASTIEGSKEYFETDAGDPFMTKICNVRMKYREALPSVTHINSSARLQTVCASINPLFHRVIEEFKKLKGVPVVINTSFNINGEPMVLSPRDAIRCFYSTGIDCLVIGSFILRKK